MSCLKKASVVDGNRSCHLAWRHRCCFHPVYHYNYDWQLLCRPHLVLLQIQGKFHVELKALQVFWVNLTLVVKQESAPTALTGEVVAP